MKDSCGHVRAGARRSALALTLVLAAALAGGCASGDSGPGGSVPRPGSSLTTPTRPDVTTRPEPTTSEPVTVPTTAIDLPTRTTEAPTIPVPPTTAPVPPTTAPVPPTEAPVVPSTPAPTTPVTPAPTTVVSTSTSSTTTTVTTLDPTAASTSSNAESSTVPWLLLIVLAAAVAGLVAWFLTHRRSQRQAWWRNAEGLVRDAGAISDLATSGPAAQTPAEQVAHWSMLEQRTQALAASLKTLLPDAPGDEARMAVAGLSTATADYLEAVQTVRALHLGPPAPTPDQLEFADAARAQRLGQLDAAAAELKRLTDGELHPA